MEQNPDLVEQAARLNEETRGDDVGGPPPPGQGGSAPLSEDDDCGPAPPRGVKSTKTPSTVRVPSGIPASTKSLSSTR